MPAEEPNAAHPRGRRGGGPAGLTLALQERQLLGRQAGGVDGNSRHAHALQQPWGHAGLSIKRSGGAACGVQLWGSVRSLRFRRSRAPHPRHYTGRGRAWKRSKAPGCVAQASAECVQSSQLGARRRSPSTFMLGLANYPRRMCRDRATACEGGPGGQRNGCLHCGLHWRKSTPLVGRLPSSQCRQPRGDDRSWTPFPELLQRGTLICSLRPILCMDCWECNL